MSRITDDEVVRTHLDLEIMRRPHLWPFPPVGEDSGKLPMRRKRPDGNEDYGLLFTAAHGQLDGFYAFLRSPIELGHGVTGGDPLLTLLMDAGWRSCEL